MAQVFRPIFFDIKRMLTQTRYSGSVSAGRGKFGAHRGRSHVTDIRVKDRSALGDKIVGGARGQRLDGQSRICRPLGGKDTAVADKKIGDVVGAPKTVNYAGGWVFAHAGCTNQMRVARLL